jgi:hypothetical protein
MYIYLIIILIFIIIFLLNFKRIETFFSFVRNKNIIEKCNPNKNDNGYINYIVDVVLKEINKCYNYNYIRKEIKNVVNECKVYTIDLTVLNINNKIEESKDIKLVFRIKDKSITIMSITNIDVLDLELMNIPIPSLGYIEYDFELEQKLPNSNYYPFNKNAEIEDQPELSEQEEYNFNHPSNFSSCLNIE